MAITGIVAQLRTTDMASSIRFYTEKLGFSVEFKYQDFYAGIRAGSQVFHLKLVDEKDPSIPYVSSRCRFAVLFMAQAATMHGIELGSISFKGGSSVASCTLKGKCVRIIIPRSSR